MLRQVFGNKVRELRIQQGLSQDELAFYCGIDRPQISKIEQGKVNVTLETIEKLSQALQIKTSLLLDETKALHPFVKWAGGKTQLLDRLHTFMPNEFKNYFEPFIGGGSFFLNLAPAKATINDFNSELICAYRCFQDDEMFRLLKEELKRHEAIHSEEYYYKIRSMDKEEEFFKLPIYVRAARMIYLNKSCFNGLYRVNSKGFSMYHLEKLSEVMQVAFDAGAKKILIPISSAVDIATVPSDLFAKFQLSFYSNPEDAVIKSLGIE